MDKKNKADKKKQPGDKKLSMAVKRMMVYSDEEWNAVLNPEQMTRELFRKCITDSLNIDDFETFATLSELFPVYFEEMISEMKDEIDGITANQADILPEEAEAGMKKFISELAEKI